MRANWIHLPLSRWEHIYEHVCLYLCRTWPITCDEQRYWKCVRPPFFCLFSSRLKDIKNTFPVTCVTVKICNIAICPFVSPSDWGIRRLGGLPFPSSYSSSMELDTELTFVELGITRNKNRAYFVRFSISIRFGLIRFCWYFYFQYVVVIAGVVFFLLGHRRRNRRRFSCNYYSNKSILFG